MAKARTVTLAGSDRKALRGAKVTALPPEERFVISVRVRPRPGAPSPDQLLAQEGALPPSERRYLTREEFAETFGADPNDIAKVENFAHDKGLTVAELHLSSRTVKLEGTAAAFKRAFGVSLKQAKAGSSTFRMRTGKITIPADLKDIIVGVHGLDSRPVAQPQFRKARKARGAAAAARPRNAQDGSLAARQVAKLYDFPLHLTGKGQCIAIIELNDMRKGKAIGAGYLASDIEAFFKSAKTPQPKVTAVGVDGGANLPGKTDSDDEVVLDIEIAGAVAPGANIVVYFAPNTTNGFIDAVKAAAHDKVRRPSVISISWGGPEDPGGRMSRQFIEGLNEAIRDAGLMGVTVCVAAGDNGSADMTSDEWDGKPHCDFPASSPFALACGGTKLRANGSGISSEVVWNEGEEGGGGGGGVSNYFAMPAYQKGYNVPKSPTGAVNRGVPDLAGNADPQTGYQIFLGGEKTTIGGTSAVAPLIAGLVALVNEDLAKKKGAKTCGFFNPLIYSASGKGAFRDITSGNNDVSGTLKGLYRAKPGWDACSGLGVPEGSKLHALLS